MLSLKFKEKLLSFYYQKVHPVLDVNIVPIIRRFYNKKNNVPHSSKAHGMLLNLKIKKLKDIWTPLENLSLNVRAKNELKTVSDSSFPGVVYTVNQYKFRQYNLPSGSKQIACFGCCNTFGYGLRDEHTWPYLLNKTLGTGLYEVKNYGFGREGSNDGMCRLVYSYLQTHKPYAIACLFPTFYIHEFFDHKKDVLGLSLYLEWRHFLKYRKHVNAHNLLFNETSAFFSFVKNFKFIETLCNLHGVKLIWHTWCLPDDSKSQLLFNIDIDTLRHFLGEKTSYLTRDNRLYNIMEYNKLNFLHDKRHHPPEYNEILAREFAALL